MTQRPLFAWRRADWNALLDLATPDERALLESQMRRAHGVGAGAVVLVIIGLVVAIVAAINNPPPPQSLVYILAVIVLVLPGAGMGLAVASMRNGAYENAKKIAMNRRPDLFDLDGNLVRESSATSARFASGRRRNTAIDSKRPCPYCGTINERDWSFCQKCAKPLPPPL